MQKTKISLTILAIVLCFSPIVANAQGGGKIQVAGIVTSAEDHEPLIGVNVIAGATTGVSTLADGSYSITVDAGTRLIFQYIGYRSVEFTVPAGSPAINYDVALESDSQKLEDVVVIAYGVRKKGSVAGSVATVKADKLENTPTAAFDQALQGQVPGLSVMAVSGEPSEATIMKIRGVNSINSGTAPLYILDGVAISSSDFNTISPADIESLSVLKDASSTSIYGARAANGVIVITT
ncbi:MAG: TonB-dependent receptor plug domain-containing protein, partial [Alistipes sp.]|nr:TonB-dependent receptor plug domain-containing protein [Alistipes sp.]